MIKAQTLLSLTTRNVLVARFHRVPVFPMNSGNRASLSLRHAAFCGLDLAAGNFRPMFAHACNQDDMASSISRMSSTGEEPAALQPGRSGAVHSQAWSSSLQNVSIR